MLFKDPEFNNLGDVTSLAIIVGIAKDWLPTIAAVLSIAWVLIRMYEWYRFRILGKKDDKF